MMASANVFQSIIGNDGHFISRDRNRHANGAIRSADAAKVISQSLYQLGLIPPPSFTGLMNISAALK